MIRWIMISIKRLSPNCREAARLISEATDHELALCDRLGLRVHLYICGACRNYRRSIRILAELMRATAGKPLPPDGECLPDAARTRIRRKLKANYN